MMSAAPRRAVTEGEVLDAAYRCFVRVGLAHTTIEDIARELGRSRPVVYRHVADKHDAFGRVTQRLLDDALAAARDGADRARTPTERVLAVALAKLELAIGVGRDSPHHARDLLAQDGGVVADRAADYIRQLRTLMIAALDGVADADRARDTADVVLALTRGLEDDLSDPNRARALLRTAVERIVPVRAPATAPEGEYPTTPRSTT